MKFSVIVPSYNSSTFLEKSLRSIIQQREDGIELELIVVDGESSDGSFEIFSKYSEHIDVLIIEPDSGPAEAINKGMKIAQGDIVSWLNADDIYFPGSLRRVKEFFEQHGESMPFSFGRCKIIDEQEKEIRQRITKFKELFFPVSSRFTYQCINYISQPALFFRKTAMLEAGLLKESMIAAWDYEYFIRLWRLGKGKIVPGYPVAAFRWHEGSISGRSFTIQFKEELEVAVNDAGKLSLQVILHHLVRIGIVTIYSMMGYWRKWKNTSCTVTR